MSNTDIAVTIVAAAACIRYRHRRIEIMAAYAAYVWRDELAALITKK